MPLLVKYFLATNPVMPHVGTTNNAVITTKSPTITAWVVKAVRLLDATVKGGINNKRNSIVDAVAANITPLRKFGFISLRYIIRLEIMEAIITTRISSPLVISIFGEKNHAANVVAE